MRTVSISHICIPEVEANTLYGPCDVFAACNGLWRAMTGKTATAECQFAPQVVGETVEPITSSFGFPIIPQARYADIDRTDVVFVPSLLVTDFDGFRLRYGELVDWIRRQYEGGALVATACTGTLLLAETGLLDGAEATSHWAASPLMRQYHPAVQLVDRRVLSFAGEGQRLVTAGGASSWQDLCLYLIMRYAGMDTAREIAKLFLFQWHRDGQSPFAAVQRNMPNDDAVIGEAQLWLSENYDKTGALARAIEHSRLNERTFNRRFRAAAGMAPSTYLQLLRIEEAKQDLETSTRPVESIAEGVGYSDEASFRRAFKKVVGMSPAEYRRKYALPTKHEIELQA